MLICVPSGCLCSCIGHSGNCLFRKAFVAMTVRHVQPKTVSTFLRHESRMEFLLHSQIPAYSFCILRTLESLLSKQSALGAEVGASTSPCTCAGALLILWGLAAGTCSPNRILVHRDCWFLCNYKIVIQLTVLCPAKKSQINSYCSPATLKCWEQIKT